MERDPEDSEYIGLMFWLVVALVVCSVGFALAQGPADKWGHDPATSEWFRGLHSPQGFPCCDYVDGTRVDDPNYRENDDGSYDVTVGAETVHVPAEKVVAGTNKVGYAILWRSPAGGAVYCFLPGART